MVHMRVILKLFALALSCSVIAPADAIASRRVALIIGNSAYQHTPPLANPKHDAIDIGEALKRHKFEIVSGFDLNKVDMDKKVREFAERIRGASVGVFFFAGHGLQVSGQNYLVPVDAKLSTAAALDWEMVRLDLVHRSMEREAATNILFVDACRNNPLARNLERAMGTRSIEIGHGLAQVEAGVGTLVSFSTQPGNVALDGTGRNSPFAGALVKHISASSDDLSAVLIAVRNDVMKDTKKKQVPWEHSALTGRFYFGTPKPIGPPPDEISWLLIKETKDGALVQRFIEQFPESKKRGEAERLSASLAASTPAPVKPVAKAPPPPVASPGLPADDVAWTLIKDTKDPALLRRFVERFPESNRRPEAERLAGQLASSAARPAASPEKAPAGNRKCFSFDGRQFCQ